MALVSVRNIKKHYRLEMADIPALADVSLDIGTGERVCLMGPSGSGKSTLLNIIGCVDKASAGETLIDGEDTGGLSDSRLSDFRNRTMGFIFQSFNLIPVLSVFENVEYPLLLRRMAPRARRRRVEELLLKVGLADYGRRSPERLSGGQRQRVAVARALVTEPQARHRGRADRLARPCDRQGRHGTHGRDERDAGFDARLRDARPGDD